MRVRSPAARRLLIVAGLAVLLVFLFVLPALADATGSDIGTAKDILEDTQLTQSNFETLAGEVGHGKIAANFVWTLVAGALVMFMQAGFAMVETGFCRAKNAAHVVMTNFVVFAVGFVGFWAVGYAIMFGGIGSVPALGGSVPLDGLVQLGTGWGLFGYKGWFLAGDSYHVSVFALFFFQVVFMDTAATIPTGGMAERWKFSAFVVYGFFISMILYPLFGNWAWGGGWLSQLGSTLKLGHGYVDFAGSGVVHAVGGMTALAGAAVLGPRIGKYDRDGNPRAIPGHHIPMAMLGTFILLFGWFGFNAGSTLAAGDLRISVVVVNTMLAGSTGALAAMFLMWWRFGKPDPSMSANGMLVGLVAITAPCAFVNSVSAAIIGAVAGIIVVASVFFIERSLKVDDPVGAASVHGAGGIWGVIAVGLFADGSYGDGWNGVEGTVKGLFYGDASQLVAQLVGVATLLTFVLGLAYLFFKVQHAVMGIRSKPEDEVGGLDLPEMGALAYPDFLEAQGDVFLPTSGTMVAAGAASLREEVGS